MRSEANTLEGYMFLRPEGKGREQAETTGENRNMILKERTEMEKEKTCPACEHRTKMRTEEETRLMVNRLNRIEGQVRGIRRMVENHAYCPDILIQVSAITAALNSFNKVLLAEHIRTCVSEDIKESKEETIDELVTVLRKLMK